MWWTVRLEARTDQGEVETTELVTFDRPVVDGTLADLGLALSEAKAVLAKLQVIMFLAKAAGDPRLRVLATLRADFLLRCADRPALAALLQAGTFPLGAPGPAALADMIRTPAERAGLDLEDALLQRSPAWAASGRVRPGRVPSTVQGLPSCRSKRRPLGAITFRNRSTG